MFSCYRSARLSIDRLERQLGLMERIKLQGHFLICSHCRTHDRQIRGLSLLVQMKQNSVEHPIAADGVTSDNVSLSDTARSRIASVLSSRFTS